MMRSFLFFVGFAATLAASFVNCAREQWGRPHIDQWQDRHRRQRVHHRSSIAVKDGKILRVGTDQEVLETKGDGTEVLDLGGKMVLPGLMDSHTHPTSASMFEFDHTVPEMESIDDVLEYIRSRTEAVAEGSWITLNQVFITRLREQRYPTRAELDRVAPRHPVVFRTGPDAAVNSLALRLSNIDATLWPQLRA